MDYKKIKELSKEMGCSYRDLIVLSPQNDPFYCGSPGRVEQAEWFAGIWDQFGCGAGFHIRRVHYRIEGMDVVKPDGSIYANTKEDWKFLSQVSKYARHLDLIDPSDFVDKRNPPASAYTDYFFDPDPSYFLDDFIFREIDAPKLPDFAVSGYEGELQPYHLEIWVEKSTINDEMIPLCRKYHAVLVTGLGELSITAVIRLMERAEQADRPVRIFYISDFDPKGMDMPKSIGRKIEFYNTGRLDIKLNPIFLTRDQVIKYKLPRKPIKETERSKGRFEDIYGEGSVELDALVARHPGELEKIVENEMARYYDTEIDRKARKKKAKLIEDLDKLRLDSISDIQEDIDEFYADFKDATEEYQNRFDELSDQVTERLEDIDLDIEDYQIPEGREGKEFKSPLYDSSLDYFEQLERYKDQK